MRACLLAAPCLASGREGRAKRGLPQRSAALSSVSRWCQPRSALGSLSGRAAARTIGRSRRGCCSSHRLPQRLRLSFLRQHDQLIRHSLCLVLTARCGICRGDTASKASSATATATRWRWAPPQTSSAGAQGDVTDTHQRVLPTLSLRLLTLFAPFHVSRRLSGHFDGGVRFWDLRKGDMAHEVASLHPQCQVTAVVASSGGSHILTNGRDNTLKLLDVRTFGILRVYRAGAFACLVTDRILSGDCVTKSALRGLAADGGPVSVRTVSYRVGTNFARPCMSQDRRVVAAGSADGLMHLWSTDTGERAATAATWRQHTEHVPSPALKSVAAATDAHSADRTRSACCLLAAQRNSWRLSVAMPTQLWRRDGARWGCPWRRRTRTGWRCSGSREVWAWRAVAARGTCF